MIKCIKDANKMDIQKEQLEEGRYSRDFLERFYYNWSILSGGTLIVSINFLINHKNIKYVSEDCLGIALFLILVSMILALIRNFAMGYLISKSLRINSISRSLKIFTWITKWLLSGIPILSYSIGVIFIFLMFFRILFL